MKAADPADLVLLLELLGNGDARGPITIPGHAANRLVEILLTIPGPRGRRPIWSEEIRRRAMKGLRDGEHINPLAHEIAAVTGQSVTSVRRRLQEMNKRRARRPAVARAKTG